MMDLEGHSHPPHLLSFSVPVVERHEQGQPIAAAWSESAGTTQGEPTPTSEPLSHRKRVAVAIHGSTSGPGFNGTRRFGCFLAYDADAFAAGYPDAPGTDSKALSYLATSGVYNQLNSEVTGGTNYGQSIALTTKAEEVFDDHVLIVGNPLDNTNGTDAGHALVYRASGGSWGQVTSLANSATAGNFVGYSLSVSEFDGINEYWYVANGAPGDGTSGTFVDVAFLRVTTSSTVVGSLGINSGVNGSGFGTSVSVSDALSTSGSGSIEVRLVASALLPPRHTLRCSSGTVAQEIGAPSTQTSILATRPQNLALRFHCQATALSSPLAIPTSEKCETTMTPEAHEL